MAGIRLSAWDRERPLRHEETTLLNLTPMDRSSGERLIGSSEVLESLIGKDQRLQSSHSKGGMTALLLSIGAMLGPLTPSTIAHALQSTRPADVDHWCKTHLGITLPSQRRPALGATINGIATPLT